MYMLININTAEVEFFSDRECAEQFKNDYELSDTIIMPCTEVEDKEEVELVIYPNTDQSSEFGSVAEYLEDVYNSDFINAPEEPVRYMTAYAYSELE